MVMKTIPPDLLLRANYTTVLGIPTTVAALSEEFIHYNWRKEGEHTISDKVSRGYFALFEGSRERLFVGIEKPDMEPGDEILIVVMRRKKDADTRPAPVQSNDQIVG